MTDSATDKANPLITQDDKAGLFEAAAEMVICGDLPALAAILDAHPSLIHATSRHPHGATLLHYSAANGVEDERQRVPPNAVEIADLLISRGADINAASDAYGGGSGSTPLVALVTGGHPNEAGLMEPLVAAYARSGQKLNGAGDDGLPMIYAFLFRNVSAAKALARAGARVNNAATAAGMGDLRLPGALPAATVLRRRSTRIPPPKGGRLRSVRGCLQSPARDRPRTHRSRGRT